MMQIEIKKSAQLDLEELAVKDWPIWEKEESSFDWHYDSTEICYFLEGDVEIEMPDGKIVSIGEGDLVTFPQGLSCRWNIKRKVRKLYNFK